MKTPSCQICSNDTFRPIWVAQRYIGEDQAPPEICQNCGFVQVNDRRSSAEIAADWKRIYIEKIYDPTWPGVKARLFYVSEWIDQNIGFQSAPAMCKEVLDIGSGQGQFLELANERGARACGLEPALGGQTVEDYQTIEKFDIVTILWTLENCGDCNAMIAKARECLKPDGHLIVATGSRIMVPFRKPMSAYFSTQPQDLHAFRWSPRSLNNIFLKHGFGDALWAHGRTDERTNDFEQNDVLLMVGRPTNSVSIGSHHCESPEAIENHFIDWYRSFP